MIANTPARTSGSFCQKTRKLPRSASQTLPRYYCLSCGVFFLLLFLFEKGKSKQLKFIRAKVRCVSLSWCWLLLIQIKIIIKATICLMIRRSAPTESDPVLAMLPIFFIYIILFVIFLFDNSTLLCCLLKVYVVWMKWLFQASVGLCLFVDKDLGQSSSELLSL